MKQDLDIFPKRIFSVFEQEASLFQPIDKQTSGYLPS